jgi:hypothetical protein
MSKAKGKITALFEFYSTSALKGIFLGAESEEDQKILETGLRRILKPSHFEWLKRLFQR